MAGATWNCSCLGASSVYNIQPCGTDTEIRVSTESRPWRRKFSRSSCRDLNPRPFSHESGALTTELSPPQTHTWLYTPTYTQSIVTGMHGLYTEKACPERKVLSRAPNPDRVGTPRRLADSDSSKVFHVYRLYNTKIQIMTTSQQTTSWRHDDDTTTIQLYYRHETTHSAKRYCLVLSPFEPRTLLSLLPPPPPPPPPTPLPSLPRRKEEERTRWKRCQMAGLSE